MEKGIKEITKKLSSIILAIIMMFSVSSSAISSMIVYAAETGQESSGANSGVETGTYSITLKPNRTNGKTAGNTVFYENNKIWDYYFETEGDYYCLKGNTRVNDSTTYTSKASLLDDASTVLNNTKNDVSYRTDDGDDGLSAEESIKALQWLAQSMYCISYDYDDNQKSYMKENLQTIINAYGGNDKATIKEITEEQIGVIQQFVVWQFINSNTSSNSSQNYYRAITKKDDLDNFKANNSKYFTDSQKDEAYAIYVSLIKGAKLNSTNNDSYILSTETLKKEAQAVKVKKDNAEVVCDGTTVTIGPLQITAGSIEKIEDQIKLNNSKTVDNKGTKIKEGTKKYLNSEKKDAGTAELKNLVNQTFYVQFETEAELKTANIEYTVTGNYKPALNLSASSAYIYMNGKNQPILRTKLKTEKLNFSEKVTINKVAEPEIDLALTKNICKVERNGESILEDELENRIPHITDTKLKNGDRTTAEYKMKKTALDVARQDIITYKLTVYNEGTSKAVVSEITDYYPDGLELVSGQGYTAESSSKDGYKCVKIKFDPEELTSGGKIEKDIKFKVSSDEGFGKTLINFAAITEYGYYNNSDEYVKAISTSTKTVDIDSEMDNFKLEEQIKKLEENKVDKKEINEDKGNYSQEDDDDFEQIRIGGFDLALRKFITQVDGTDITELGYKSREPKITATTWVTIARWFLGDKSKYEHEKTPIEVTKNSSIVYTIRIYNEGYIDGYAKEITDILPKGLKLKTESEINTTYKWKVDSKDSQKVTTDYLNRTELKAIGGAVRIHEI